MASSPQKMKKVASRKTGKKGDGEKRREEERRRAEEAVFESRERERMAIAENDSRLWAMDLARRAQNAERRQKELQDASELEQERALRLEDFHTRKMKEAEWRAYLAAAEGSALITPRGSTVVTPRIRQVPIDPSNEAEVNTWLSLWADKDVDLKETLQDAQIAENIIRDMDRIFTAAERRGDQTLIARLQRDIAALRDMGVQKIDRATAHVIQHADEHANAKNEVLLAYDTGDIKFCMWINLSKNPRVKTIEFADLSISIDIPKNLALSSVAVRLIHYRYDNFSLMNYGESASLGGVMFLDLLSLPPPPKRVKGWTLRQVTPLATNISRFPYPAHSAHIGSSISSSDLQSTPSGTSLSLNNPLTAAPIRISWPIPRDVLVGESQVGWWDAEAGTWRLDSVTDMEYNPETRALSLHTYFPTPLALTHKSAQLYPLAGWELDPSPDRANAAVLTLFTRTGVGIQIQIGEGTCTLVRPDNEELQHLRVQPLEPGLLLKKLALSGLILSSNPALPPAVVTPKDEALERDICRHIALTVRSFSFRQSHANQISGPQMCLFQVTPTKRIPSASGLRSSSMEAWRTVRFIDRGCQLLNGEPSEHDDINAIDDEDLHTHLIQCLEPLNPDLQEIAWASSAALTECTETLLSLLRLFSYTS